MGKVIVWSLPNRAMTPKSPKLMVVANATARPSGLRKVGQSIMVARLRPFMPKESDSFWCCAAIASTAGARVLSI